MPHPCKASVIMVSLVTLFLSACGYRMAGGGGLPGGIQSLHVQLIENRTSETGAEALITNALINELNRRIQGVVVGAQDAQATLSGAIEALKWDTVTRKGLSTAAERRVYASLSLTLTAINGDTLWKRSDLRAEQAYAVVGGDTIATENNRRQAIRELSQRLAENVYRRLTDQF